jgi:hypothetical protein
MATRTTWWCGCQIGTRGTRNYRLCIALHWNARGKVDLIWMSLLWTRHVPLAGDQVDVDAAFGVISHGGSGVGNTTPQLRVKQPERL